MKVLLVDDSSFSQRITANLLKKFLQNVEFYFSMDGEEGFEKYKEIKPDYIFVDLLMPKLNGKELIDILKKYDKNAKIIVLSADVQMGVKKEIEEKGILSFINKPFNKEKAESICDMIRNDYNE